MHLIYIPDRSSFLLPQKTEKGGWIAGVQRTSLREYFYFSSLLNETEVFNKSMITVYMQLKFNL